MNYEKLVELIDQAEYHSTHDESAAAEALCLSIISSLQSTNYPALLARIENIFARTLGMTNRYHEAIDHAEAAYQFAVESDNKKEQIRSLASIGSANNLLSNYPAALHYFDHALAVAEEINDKESVANILSYLGSIYRNMADFPRALEYLTKALTLAEELHNLTRVAHIQNTLGSVYTHFSDYPRALEWYFKSLAVHEQQNNKRGMLVVMSGIGSVYSHLADYPKAREFHLKSLALSEELNDKNMMSTTLGNIGNIYTHLAEYTLAAEYLHRSIEIAEQVGNKTNLATHLSNIAMVYTSMSDYTRGLEYANRSLEIWRNLNNQNGIATNLSNIGSIYTYLKQYPLALEYLNEALTIHTEINNILAGIHSLENIGEVYYIQKDFTNALYCFYRAIEQAEDIGSRSEIANALGAIGNIFADTAYSGYNPQSAETNLLEALNIFNELGKKKQLAAFHRTIAQLYRQLNRWKDAFEHLEKATAIEDEIHADRAHRSVIAAETQREITKHDNARRQAEYEREIERLRNEELAAANDRIMLQNQQLEHLNHEKDEFLGIAAHDLKNPLAGIILNIDFLLKYPDSVSPAMINDALIGIRKTSLRMKDIISNLLSINAAERGAIQLTIESVECVAILQSAIADYAERAAQKSLQIIPNFSQKTIRCTADKALITAVIDNLLSNAVKYSPTGKRIWVEIVRQTNDTAQFIIRDEGLGLTPEDKDKLFGKFQKLSARPTAGEHSTGLGLSIVKKLVEMMNGKVWAESEGAGKGATFTIEMPIDATSSNN
jgi:signal transduction histidine kinase